MIKTNDLRAIIVKNNLSQKDVAKAIGVTPKTFYLKMERGGFGSDDIEKMINLLNIEEPSNIFFAKQ